jgi:hypothetical protein
MADLNSLIAQGAQFQAPQDPFAQYAKMQQLQQGQQANALNRMKMDEYQRALASQNALRTSPAPEGVNPQHWAIDPKEALAIAKEQSAAGASKSAASRSDAAAAADRQKILNQAERDFSSRPDDENLISHNRDIQESTLFTSEEKSRLDGLTQKLLAMPIEQRKMVLSQQGASAGEMKPTISSQNLGGTVQSISTPAFGGPATVVPGSVGNVTMTPYQIEQNKISQGQLKVSQGQLKVAQDRLAKEGAQLDPLENQVLSQAIADGRVDINKVNGRNAKIYVGALQAQPGVDLREMSFENVASAAGARSLGVQSAKMQTAAIEADKMIGLVNQYSNAVDRTQYPTINAIENAISKGTGDTNIVKLHTSLNSLINSYARAISPTGQPTVSDKNHAREIINANYANGQIGAITDVMHQEMNIAKGSTKEAGDAAKADRQKKPGAPAKSASGATVSNW